jgi:hypothetical protein
MEKIKSIAERKEEKERLLNKSREDERRPGRLRVGKRNKETGRNSFGCFVFGAPVKPLTKQLSTEYRLTILPKKIGSYLSPLMAWRSYSWLMAASSTFHLLGRSRTQSMPPHVLIMQSIEAIKSAGKGIACRYT